MFSCEPLVAPGSRYYNYAAGALARSSLLCLQCIIIAATAYFCLYFHCNLLF